MDKLFRKKTFFIAFQNFIQEKRYLSFPRAFSGFHSESAKIWFIFQNHVNAFVFSKNIHLKNLYEFLTVLRSSKAIPGKIFLNFEKISGSVRYFCLKYLHWIVPNWYNFFILNFCSDIEILICVQFRLKSMRALCFLLISL